MPALPRPPVHTLERTRAVVDQIQQAAKGIPAIKSVSSLAGTNVLIGRYGRYLWDLSDQPQRLGSSVRSR